MKQLYFLLKFGMLLSVSLALVGIGQASQAFKLNDDLRRHVINQWVDSESSRAEIAERFVATCIEGRASIQNMEKKFVTVYECGESIGANDLAAAVKESDKILRTLAWPLSTLE